MGWANDARTKFGKNVLSLSSSPWNTSIKNKKCNAWNISYKLYPVRSILLPSLRSFPWIYVFWLAKQTFQRTNWLPLLFQLLNKTNITPSSSSHRFPKRDVMNVLLLLSPFATCVLFFFIHQPHFVNFCPILTTRWFNSFQLSACLQKSAEYREWK